MTVDPRAPVVVGVGQVNHQGGEAPEPVDLLALASKQAAADAGSERILSAIQSVRVVRILSRRYRDPGALVAERIGACPSQSAVSTDGGNSPQMLVNATAAAIQRGELEVALIGGAESWKTRMAYKAKGENTPWTFQPDSVPPAEVIGARLAMTSEHERGLGLVDPVQVYPLFETALRARHRLGIDEHRQRIAQLWARFSEVGAANPWAAVRDGFSPAAIATPGPENRMIGFPYTKLFCANNSVDQAAALLVCSAERARQLGVPSDRWVFVHSGAEAHDTPFVSNRFDLASSPAIRAAGKAALGLAGLSAADVEFVDLYSCFPSAVQVAAAELGLSCERELTVTGGLTFAGGPWNNYVTHAMASMVLRLRDHAGARGLCSANGGFLTKHALGVYAAHPPRDPFRVADVQAEVGALPARHLSEFHHGPASVEAYTVMHRRDGEPEQAFVSCRLDDGRRTWAISTDPDLLGAMMTVEFCGRQVRLGPDATIKDVIT